MVCFHRSFLQGRAFEFPETLPGGRSPSLSEVIEQTPVDDKYVLSEHLWGYLFDYAAKHRAAGNGFGFGLVGPSDIARTLSARYHKDGSEILFHELGAGILGRDSAGNLTRHPGYRPRRLTPRECARLMGYPDSFEIRVSDTQAYRQFGNSVVVPVIESLGNELVRQVARGQFATSRADRLAAEGEVAAQSV